MLLAPISNEKFKYEHLTASPQNLEEIKSFTVTRETGRGLERYLKEIAEHDEYSSANRTYLVRDKKTNEIAAYFSLRAGSFTLKTPSQGGEDESKYTVPSVELSNFAVNSAYRGRHPETMKLGEQVFRRFIIPTVRKPVAPAPLRRGSSPPCRAYALAPWFASAASRLRPCAALFTQVRAYAFALCFVSAILIPAAS